MVRLTLLMFMVVPALIRAQEITPWANKFFSEKQDAVPAVISHDFGTVPKGKVVTYRFKMTNIYSVPMTLVEPKPSCGCVSVLQYSPRLDVLESGFIDLKLDTNKYEGGFKRVRLPVTFIGQDPKTGERFQSTADIAVQITSRVDIVMTPGSINFGMLAEGTKSRQSLRVLYTGRQANWAITNVAYDSTKYEVTVDPEQTRTGRAYTVTVALKDTIRAGVLDDEIALNTNDTSSPVLKVSVLGKIEASITLSPSELRLGQSKVGVAKEQKVIIRANKNFKIQEILGQDEELQASFAPVPENKIAVFSVKLTPKQAGTSLKKTLTVVTNNGDKVPLTVEAIGIE